MLATAFGGRALGLPNRNGNTELTSAEAQNDTSDSELDQRVR